MVKKIFVDGIMHLGDMIIASSVFPVLKKAYPEAKIYFLTTENLTQVAAMIEGVDEVIPYAYKSGGSVKGVFEMAKKLKAENFDIGISLDPRERVTLMKWLANIPIRVSLEEALGWRLGWERLFYTHDVSLKGWDVKNKLMSESFFEAMRRFTRVKDKKFIYPSIKPSSETALEKAKEILAPLSQRRAVIAFCVATSGDNRSKDWSDRNFSDLCNSLAKQGYGFVFTGIEEHKPIVKRIIDRLTNKDIAVDLAGKTDFEELVAIFRQTDLLISLDTGAPHLAAAAGAKALTIFSFNSPEIYQAAGDHTAFVSTNAPCAGKYRCLNRKKCLKSDCVKNITVEMVEEAALKLLNQD